MVRVSDVVLWAYVRIIVDVLGSQFQKKRMIQTVLHI